ncbi:hypothetical protein BJ875DRAFT_462667 [Amylocarpus encephaloides]|uniref:Poly A polymerase head domain-containing protein n=1 Tax=Amylocarpus encephaloides TaxID=45428 RepID=A0A9P8C4W6_9HELO|nr:hypothetical protein BJ875DRAFT_462667 [Amylocarpus encephaloides]
MLCYSKSSLLPTREILRLTLRVTTAFTYNYSSCAFMKKKEFCADHSTQPGLKRLRRTMATRKIELTAQEQRLRGLLLDVAQFIDEAIDIKEKIELRWAGGWVRDKLLDIPSHDIDTAINSMTGLAFCERMQEYASDPKNLKKHSLEKKDIGNLHTIAANPVKSKHLETTTIRILGYDVDFVNLRKETYTSDSRNPQMEFGMAEEDALRRDATMNSLFYNLRSDEVEDFCGGLEDLRAKRIRTPLEPLTTFTDDPLRVLRLIRFASRLEFKIDPETETAMSDPAVKEALKVKISRERVGAELEKMLKGKHPKDALRIIDRLGLYNMIFTDPTTEELNSPETTTWQVVYDCLDRLSRNETPGPIYKSLVRSEDAEYSAWILAALTPWLSIPQPKNPTGGTKAGPLLATAVAREGIKCNNKISDNVAAAFRNYREIITLRDAIEAKEPYTKERDTLGMQIRRWDFQGKNWRLQILLAIFVEVLQKGELDYSEIISRWQRFIDYLEGVDLMDAPAIKPIVTGVMVMKALGGIKAGAWMKPALDVCMEWQLRNPGEEDPKGAIDEVVKRRKELKVPEA